MAQHDFNIANAPGATVRADINALAEALASQNSGTSAPSVTFPFMLWADTTNNLLKIRNAANSAWITLASIVGSTFTLDDGALAIPSSGSWFGTTQRIPRINTSGVMEVGGTIDLHPDAAGTEDYRARINRATGANGALTVENTGSGGLNLVPGSGGFKVDGVLVTGKYVGEPFPWFGTTAPAKCVFLYGQNLSRTTYSDLFGLWGTTYGNGDGTTTFGVPDMRGRVIAGKDNMGGTAASRLTGTSGGVNGTVLGAAGGAQQHQLITAELASHTHTGNPTSGRYGANSDPQTVFRPSSGDSTGSTVTIIINNAGGDTPHNNVQPTIIANYVVYTGV